MTERIKQCDIVESCVDCPRYGDDCDGNKRIEHTDLISRADAIEAWDKLSKRGRTEFDQVLMTLPSADAVSQSEQYKKGFEDAKRAFLIEYARESENMRKRNAQLEVMLNAQKAISADAVHGEWIEKGGELVCSVCGNSVSFSRTPKGWVLGKFCQSCGTRMKGGDDE